MADSGDVVKRITITANGDGIDTTTSSLNSLSDAYDKAADSSQLTLGGMVSLGAGIGGAIASLLAFSNYIAGVNKDLADMATIANQVGLTLKDFQSIQFGGALSGLSTDQVNAGLQQSATLLNDASRNANTLSKEFAANGLSVKDTNGQLISQNQLLTVAAGLVANAKNPGDAAAIATMLGYTKDWIPLLEEIASQSLPGIAKAAQDAGVIIDDATIAKATEFDTQWRASSVTFAANMKAAFAEVLPVIDDLLLRASKFAGTIKASDIQAASNASFEQTGLPDSAVIKIDPEGLTTATKEFLGSPIFVTQTWMDFGKALYTGFQVMTTEKASDTIPGYAASQVVEPSYPSADQMDAAFKKAGTSIDATSQKAKDWAQDAAQDAADGFSKVAAKGSDANDILDRAINTLQKHTDQTAADADAVGLGAGALAGLRGEAALTSAAIANGTAITPALTAKFRDLSASAADAADDLAKVQVASVISRGSQTAFLSPEDLAIANQLKGIYGDNIPAALNSSQAAALRLNNVFSTINTTIRTGATTFVTDFADALVKGQSLMSSLQTAASALGKTLLDSGLKSLVTTGLNAVAPSLSSSATETAGATSTATILTAAATAMVATWTAGATAAAGILAGGGTAAGVGIDAGTSVGGATLVTSGTVGGASLATGGAAAGGFIDAAAAVLGVSTAALSAIMGPLAALLAVGAGVGMSLFGGSSGPSSADKIKADNQLAQQAQQQNQDAQDRQVLDQQNGQLAGIDQTTLQGQLQAFDISSQQQREAEAKAGNGAIVELESSLAAQRLAIIQKSNEAITKSMDDFLTSLKTGSLSILSPQDQLNAEQTLFNTQLAGAQGGNSDDLNALTTTAQSLLTLAQNFYASGTGYADTYNQVTSAISALANGGVNQSTFADPNVTNTQDTTAAYSGASDGVWQFSGLAPGTVPATDSLSGMAEGGIVGNGVFNKDSVVARYAGGGSIALAGGEAVTRASSVNANTISALNFINKTGKTPSNNNDDVVRVLTQGFNGQTTVLGDKLDTLASRVKSLEDTTRQTNNKRRVPGTKAA
jgi:hypothetical protein